MRRLWLLISFCVLLSSIPVSAIAEIDVHLALLLKPEQKKEYREDRLARMVVSLVGETCTPASSNPDVQFFWRIEDTDVSTPDDYSAGGNTMTGCGAGEAINSTRVKMGTNSLDGQSGSCTTTGGECYKLTTNEEDVWDGSEDLNVGFWINFDCDEGTEQPSQIVFHKSGGTEYLRIWQTSGPVITVLHQDSGTSESVTCSGSLSLDTWYFVVVKVDRDGGAIYVDAYPESNIWGSPTCTDSDTGLTLDAITIAGGDLTVGNNFGPQTDDWFEDHVIMSKDITDDLRYYANDPTYSTCAAD